RLPAAHQRSAREGKLSNSRTRSPPMQRKAHHVIHARHRRPRCRQVLRPFQALDKLDLTVRTGQVAGFLGPNGSGRSTTIRVLLGLLRADSGSLRLLGGDPWTEAVSLHRRLAYVPGDVSLWPNLTGGQAIDLLGRLRGG